MDSFTGVPKHEVLTCTSWAQLGAVNTQEPKHGTTPERMIESNAANPLRNGPHAKTPVCVPTQALKQP